MIMTEDKARKIAARQRMAQTGEPYSVARHAVEDEHASSADPLDGMAEDAGAAEAQTHPQEQAEQARRLADDSEDGPPRRHHRPPRPSNPPRPPRPPRPASAPRPPRVRHYGPHGQDDWPQQRPDPAERLQDQVDQFIQRLSAARDQADRLISAAERIFTPARSERIHSEPVHSEPPSGEAGPADPA